MKSLGRMFRGLSATMVATRKRALVALTLASVGALAVVPVASAATAGRAAPRLSVAHMDGLHLTRDPLDLRSSAALVIDQDTQEILFGKNMHAVLPIASVTKLMMGLLVSEAGLPMGEIITITGDDVDRLKGSSSRLPVGARLSRGELLHLALMSSENRAAHALGRTFPGGLRHFVGLMNARAMMLGMGSTHYVDPTGLSPQNRSSATDLALLVAEASRNPMVTRLTTSSGHDVVVGSKLIKYGSTNGFVRNPDWNIGVQKTGFISEAGRCLVMQTSVSGRRVIMVFLDSSDRYGSFADATTIRDWVQSFTPTNTLTQYSRAP